MNRNLLSQNSSSSLHRQGEGFCLLFFRNILLKFLHVYHQNSEVTFVIKKLHKLKGQFAVFAFIARSIILIFAVAAHFLLFEITIGLSWEICCCFFHFISTHSWHFLLLVFLLFHHIIFWILIIAKSQIIFVKVCLLLIRKGLSLLLFLASVCFNMFHYLR